MLDFMQNNTLRAFLLKFNALGKETQLQGKIDIRMKHQKGKLQKGESEIYWNNALPWGLIKFKEIPQIPPELKMMNWDKEAKSNE